MKNLATTFFTVLLFLNSFSQSNDRLFNMDYMETVLMENFSSSNLDRTIWQPQTNFKRNLGFLIDSIITINVENGKLELKIATCP